METIESVGPTAAQVLLLRLWAAERELHVPKAELCTQINRLRASGYTTEVAADMVLGAAKPREP